MKSSEDTENESNDETDDDYDSETGHFQDEERPNLFPLLSESQGWHYLHQVWNEINQPVSANRNFIVGRFYAAIYCEEKTGNKTRNVLCVGKILFRHMFDDIGPALYMTIDCLNGAVEDVTVLEDTPAHNTTRAAFFWHLLYLV